MNNKKVIQIHRGKNKVWIGSIIAALIAAVAVFAVMMQMERNLLAQYEKGSILIAVQEIPKGQLITQENAVAYFEETELDQNCIPETALRSMEQITDMVPVAEIEKGVLLTEGMFEKVNEITAGMKVPVIAGFKADDLYQVVGGVLRAGDRIHIYQVAEEGEACLNWQNVYVQQVFDNSGNHIGNDDRETAAQRVNVYLEQENVEQFYSQVAAGTLRVVKVCE